MSLDRRMYFLLLRSVELYDMSQLHHLVLDEADTLFDDSFSDLTMRLISRMKVLRPGFLLNLVT